MSEEDSGPFRWSTSGRFAHGPGNPQAAAARWIYWVGWVAGLAAFAAGVWDALGAYDFLIQQDRLLRWDMAKNGFQALELALDLENGRVLQFLRHLNQHDPWPPGYSLLLVPFFLVMGASEAAAALPHTILFALTPPALVLLARQVDKGVAGLLAGLIAAVLFLASPFMRVFSILVMREIPGAFFTVLAIWAYLRATERRSLGAWRLAGGLALGLVMIKYNYGLVWIGIALLNECVLRGPTERRRSVDFLRRHLWPWKEGPLRRRLLAGILYATGLLYVLGESVGLILYAMLLIATFAVAHRWQGQQKTASAQWKAMACRDRATLEILVVPLWIWFLSPSPNHVRGAIDFLRNRDSGLGLVDDLTFYPWTFLRYFVEDRTVGVAILAAAVIGTVLYLRTASPGRILALFAGIALMTTVLHPYKVQRFLLTPLPVVFLLAGLATYRVLQALCPFRRLRPLVGGLLTTAVLVGLIVETRPPSAVRLTNGYAVNSADSSLRLILADIQRAATRKAPIGFVGAFDEISPALLSWSLYQRPVSRRFGVLPSLSEIPLDAADAVVEAELSEWLEKGQAQQVLALRLEPESSLMTPDYRRYHAWQNRALKALEASSSWRVEAIHRYPSAGLSWTLFSRATLTPMEAFD